MGWRPAIIGLKVFFVPCAGRLASPIFQRWMTLSIYRWIALPKALWFSNPCTASSFTAPRAMSRWNPNETHPKRRSCHSKNRDRAGRWSASAPTGGASARPKTFSDAIFAAAISMRGISMGSGSQRPAAASRARSSAVALTDHQGARPWRVRNLAKGAMFRLIAPTHGDAALMNPATKINAEKPQSSRPKLQAVSAPLDL